ncbi:hypothetical protein CTAYLR_001818, partial [Chrysophaeum taylorii]
MQQQGPRKRRRRTRLRIGFIVGKKDGDLVLAPGIPAKHWVSSAFADEPPPHKPLREIVHTDVAIWWHVRQHYGSVVEADLVSAPEEVTAARLGKNDVNLLLGWDAVSAHLEEADVAIGHGENMRELLSSPESRVWPPGDLQALCNNKGDYMRLAEARGIAIAPTEVYDCSGGPEAFASFAVDVARRRGWTKFVAKPSPSSWSRGVETFSTDGHDLEPALETYFAATVKGAKQIVLQRHLDGLEIHPETRCFYFDGAFMYAVANSRHPRDHPFEITDHPEAASTAPAGTPRALPPEFWRAHSRLGLEVVRDLLPDLRAFDGRELPHFPWLVRCDVGMHDPKDLVNAADDADGGKAVFLNEIEIVPTLYLDPKFGHDRDFVAEYAAKFVKSAADAAG